MQFFVDKKVGWLVGFMACQPLLDYFMPKSVEQLWF